MVCLAASSVALGQRTAVDNFQRPGKLKLTTHSRFSLLLSFRVYKCQDAAIKTKWHQFTAFSPDALKEDALVIASWEELTKDF